MASLLELHRALFPAARLIGADRLTPDHGARDVSWVRVLRGDALTLESVESTDLVIVPPGMGLHPSTLAGELSRTGVPAALVMDAGDDAAPLGVPTFALEGVDVVALERSIIGFLVNQRAELDLGPLHKGDSVRERLPARVCSGVLRGKVQVQILNKSQVAETRGPYSLYCGT